MNELGHLLEGLGFEVGQVIDGLRLIEKCHKDVLSQPLYWQLKTHAQATENMLFGLINQVAHLTTDDTKEVAG